MFEKILALIAPHSCLACGAEDALLCSSCASLLANHPPYCYRCRRLTAGFRTCRSCQSSSALYAVHAAAMYEGAAKELVWRLKFSRARAAAKDIARVLPLPSSAGRERLLVHIPTATSRIRQRGYDQAALIARELATIHRLPRVAGLARQGQSRQVGATAAVRRAQQRAAFRVTAPAVRDKHIILIDDVITSGATLEAAAQALKQAGAWRIDAVVFGRA